MSDVTPAITSVTEAGFTVDSNTETPDQIRDNFASEEQPKDGEPPDPAKEAEERVSKAASELGKKGAEAAAKARKEAKPAKAPVSGAERLAEIERIRKGKTERDDLADEAEADEEEPETVEAAPEKKGNPRHDPKARIAELARERREAKEALSRAESERARLAAENEQLRSAKATPAPKPAERKAPAGEAAADTDDPRPEADDYAVYEDFVDARARWAARQEHKQIQQREQVHRQADAFTRVIGDVVSKHNARVEEAGGDEFLAQFSSEFLDALKPGWTVPAGERPTPLNYITDEILASEHGTKIMKHLWDNPEDFQRIATLRTPRDIAREMAKLETRFDAATTATSAPKPEVSKAKPPIRPVSGTPTAADSTDVSDDIPFEEHLKRMNARDRASRAGGARL